MSMTSNCYSFIAAAINQYLQMCDDYYFLIGQVAMHFSKDSLQAARNEYGTPIAVTETHSE
jgi:hypothetical protein